MNISKTSIPYLILVAMVIMFAALARAENTQDWEERDVPLVGRIAYLEGTLTRYDAQQKEWVETVQNAPVGAGDRLYSDPGARVELLLPNNTWIRMDADTEIRLTAMDETFTEVDITLGTARLYNKSSTTQIKATTPFGALFIPAGSRADLYLYSDGVDIIALEQQVYFVHNRSGRRHEVTEDGAALFADTHRVSTSRAEVTADWGKWNTKMDALWARRTQSRGKSVAYLPSELHHDAYDLDTYGRWERVYYQGSYYRFWRPIHVHVGWAPFTSGYWHRWWHDHVWIPHEPFGYVTHHYGNWVFTSGRWYWAPPVTRVMIHARRPLFRIGLAWYPGRVAWVHSGIHVGWFPLAPYEPYYCHRPWGRRAFVITKHGRRHHHRHNYKHRRHAKVIHKKHLYRGKNYRDARIKNISRVAATGGFRTIPVINKSMVKDDHQRDSIKRFKHRSEIRKGQGARARDKHRDRLNHRVTKPNPLLYRNNERPHMKSKTKDKRSNRNRRDVKPAVSSRHHRHQKRYAVKTRPNIRPLAEKKHRTTKKIRPAKTAKKRLIEKDVLTPASARVSKVQKHRRPDIRPKSVKTRVKPKVTRKTAIQSRTGQSTAYRSQPQRQEKAFGRHAYQQKSANPSGYAPRKWRNSRTSGYRSGHGGGYRQGR